MFKNQGYVFRKTYMKAYRLLNFSEGLWNPAALDIYNRMSFISSRQVSAKLHVQNFNYVIMIFVDKYGKAAA